MTTINGARRLLVAAALAGVGLAATGCNDGTAAQSPSTETVTVAAAGDSSSAAPTSDAASGGGSGSSGQAGAQLPADWPDDNFPIPPGVSVARAENPAEIGIILGGKAPDEIATFYRSALPAAGYTVTDDNSVSVGPSKIIGMKFTGHGFSGQLAVVNQRVLISLDKV